MNSINTVEELIFLLGLITRPSMPNDFKDELVRAVLSLMEKNKSDDKAMEKILPIVVNVFMLDDVKISLPIMEKFLECWPNSVDDRSLQIAFSYAFRSKKKQIREFAISKPLADESDLIEMLPTISSLNALKKAVEIIGMFGNMQGFLAIGDLLQDGCQSCDHFCILVKDGLSQLAKHPVTSARACALLMLIVSGDIGSKWGDEVKVQALETMRDVIVSMANDD